MGLAQCFKRNKQAQPHSHLAYQLGCGWGFKMPIVENYTLVTRQNHNGGPKIKKYRLIMDWHSGFVGYCVGYCESCNKSLLLPAGDLHDFIEQTKGVDKMGTHKFNLRKFVIKTLGGEVVE